MLEDPGLDLAELAAALQAAWALDASGFTFVPSHDMRAVSYVVALADGEGRAFLKVRLERPHAPLAVPRALVEAGIPDILAAIPTLTGELAHTIRADRTLVLYLYVAGRNAMDAGMTRHQWQRFGTTLRAVHESGLEVRFAGSLPAETFGLASAELVLGVMERAQREIWPSPGQTRLAALLREQSATIEATLTRATALGETLRGRTFEHVLCHADIHAANILVTDDDGIVVVDWDGPKLGPRERDLLFVIGSRIARAVTPQEEAWFFQGYGALPVDPDAIAYYRYERILEDIAETGRSVFDGDASETSRAAEVTLAATWFGAGGDIASAEIVDTRLAASGGRWDNGRPPDTRADRRPDMAETATALANKPAWIDLSSSDAAASRDFYAKLLGWQVEVNPDPQYGGYAIAKIDGKDVAGIGPAQSPGAPTAWSLYIGTDDAEDLAKRVTAAGGTVVAPPFDVGNQGRMAVFQDPSGAYISAWQPSAMFGFQSEVQGAFQWGELNARGIEKALPFYTTLFGWTTKVSPMGEDQPPYTEFLYDGQSIAGAWEMNPMVPAEVPSYWQIYFSVDDVDASARVAIEAGARELLPAQDFPGGRFAILADPQGAGFGLLKLKPRE